jgi:hypothetical protein
LSLKDTNSYIDTKLLQLSLKGKAIHYIGEDDIYFEDKDTVSISEILASRHIFEWFHVVDQLCGLFCIVIDIDDCMIYLAVKERVF